MIMDYPHCKNCKKLIYFYPHGYIDCRVWGTCLGYNNAARCPFYEQDEEKQS